MRDWGKFVQSKLAGLRLAPGARAEVFEELASHLDETFEELRRQGLTEVEAARRTLLQVQDWHDLRRTIQTARMEENIMTNRVKQFWLPGFLTFVLSTGLITLTSIFGPKPWALMRVGQPPVVLFFIPWLLSLPLVGAVGAYLSHRAGGSRRAIFSSIVFPVLPYLASILVVLPVSLLLDRFIAHNIAPMALVMALLGWVLVPGVALLAGGLPTQFFLSRQLDSRRIAGN
jgi:hypothetical protein